MKFELSDDQALLRSSTRDFVEQELPLEKTRRLAEHDARGYDPRDWERFAEMGYLGLVLPESAGGQGLGPIELAVVCEELGRACAPGPFVDVVLAAQMLAGAGGHGALLGEIVAGRKLVTIARDDAPYRGEHGPGARFANGRVRGDKHFVPFAVHADALLAVTPEGICLVEAPFEATPLETIDLTRRFARVRLDHAAALVGPASLLEPVDRLAAVAGGATLLGLMSRSLESTLEYVKTREAFGRPIGAFQALQHRLADMLLRAESTRSAVYRAAWCLATGDPDAALACASAKA